MPRARRRSGGGASTGWAASFTVEHNWVASLYPKEAQDQFFAGGRYIVDTVADPATEISLQEAQGLYGDEFARLRTVRSGSWLGREHQGPANGDHHGSTPAATTASVSTATMRAGTPSSAAIASTNARSGGSSGIARLIRRPTISRVTRW